MTLQESVRIALETSPITKTLKVDAGIGDARLQQIRGDLHPQISFSLEKGTYKPDSGVWDDTHKSKLEFRQLVYDFYQTGYRIDSATATLKAREFSVKEGEQRLALLVSRTYLELLRLDRMLFLLDENIGVYEKLLETMKQREQAGASSYSEVQQVAALLESAKKDKIGFVADREFAEEAFEFTVGQPPENLESPQLELLSMEQQDEYLLLQQAKASYYGVRVKNEEVEAARATVKSSHRDLFPTFTLEGSWTRQESIRTRPEDNLDQRKWTEEQQVQLVMNYDLWDGRKARGKKKENQLLLTRSQYQRDEYLKNLQKDIRAEWSNMRRLEAERKSNDEYLKVSQEVVELYRKEFELGEKSLLDISTAQRDHHRAKMDDARLSFDYYSSVMSLLLFQNAVIEKIQQL